MPAATLARAQNMLTNRTNRLADSVLAAGRVQNGSGKRSSHIRGKIDGQGEIRVISGLLLKRKGNTYSCRCLEPNRLVRQRRHATAPVLYHHNQINRIRRFGEEMHIPPAFRVEDQDAIIAMMRAAGLCQLVTATAAGPIATPIPMIIDSGEGEYGTLYGHLAKANPQWREPVIGDALVIFMGADAYVTPSWYVSKQEHGKVVPTWNYEAVQAFGPAEFFEDADRLRDIVTRLTDRHEKERANRWRVTDAPSAFIQAQLRAIVGVRMPIMRLVAKRKMSQNRSAEDRAGVARGLSESGCPVHRRVAGLIPLTP